MAAADRVEIIYSEELKGNFFNCRNLNEGNFKFDFLIDFPLGFDPVGFHLIFRLARLDFEGLDLRGFGIHLDPVRFFRLFLEIFLFIFLRFFLGILLERVVLVQDSADS